MSYRTTRLPMLSLKTISEAEKLAQYDSVDEDVITSYNEFALASLIYFGMKENAASEQSSRMTAMDGASKNAGRSYHIVCNIITYIVHDDSKNAHKNYIFHTIAYVSCDDGNKSASKGYYYNCVDGASTNAGKYVCRKYIASSPLPVFLPFGEFYSWNVKYCLGRE